MAWSEFAGFIVVLAAAAAIPGPDIAAIIGSCLAGGFRRAFVVIIGIVAGHALWMLAAATGLAAIAQALGPAFIAVKIGAALYLLWLAYQLWTAPVDDELPAEDFAPRRGAGLLTGLVVALSNPKALVFFSAVVPAVLPVSALSAPDVALVVAASSATLFAVFTSWALIAAQARTLLKKAARRQALNRVSAVVLAGTGIAVASR